MKKKTAFIFPGQGAQYIGMGKEFYEQIPACKAVYDLASEVTGLDVAALCFEENDKINITECQGSDGARGSVLSCNNRPVNNPYQKNDTSLDYVHMNGQAVYKFAVKTVPEAISQAIEKAGIKTDDVKYFILHQANYRIIEAVAKRLGQPMEKFPTNLQECGNISAASVPILLDKVHNHGMIGKGDKIVPAGFGAGLTWGAAVLSW